MGHSSLVCWLKLAVCKVDSLVLASTGSPFSQSPNGAKGRKREGESGLNYEYIGI